MRVVFAHNQYRFRGGEDESRDQEIALLRANGHEVFDYIVSNRDIESEGYLSVGRRSIWNQKQFEKIKSFMSEVNADILKVDNYFPMLSPAIFSAAKSIGVATVLSVRNYRLVCPAGSLYRDGKLCTTCVGKPLGLAGTMHGCYRGSRIQTAAISISNAYGHWNGTWNNAVDRYIAVSEFVKRQLVSGGYPESKISVKSNSIVDTGVGDGSGHYAVYVGRLIPEKGVLTMLNAWKRIGTKLPLKVIGEGALSTVVAEAESNTPGVTYLGKKSIHEVCEILGQASMLIFPSEWYEPFGRAIVEAYSKGTPVVAANTESLRDLVQHDFTGKLFTSGDSDKLAETVLSLINDKEALAALRISARKRYLDQYSTRQNYLQLMAIFESALGRPIPQTVESDIVAPVG